MNSSTFLPCKLLFRKTRTFMSLPDYYYNCTFTTSSFKLHFHSNAKSQNFGKTVKESIDSENETDTFGTLRKPLEKDFKTKYDSSYNSNVQNVKRVIKVKRPQNNESDIFGNLSEKKPFWFSDLTEEPPKTENDLSDDSVILKTFGKRYRCPETYLSEMKKLIKDKKIKDALNLFVEMRRQFVAPTRPQFTYMIGVCGRIGYTEMAFKLFRQMTDRAFNPSPSTLTGLFNACAESPFPEYGLKKAHYLKEKIETKGWVLTQSIYHSMIKAFGKCGDLTTAFKVVDEMAKADIEISVETYSFLLMSCISNKEAGFTYAVEVWRKMKAKKCAPNIFTFNLFLRAARDCGVGPEEISCLLLQHWSSYSKRPYGFLTKEELLKEPVLKLESKTEEIVSEPSEQNEHQNIESKSEYLNESFTSKQASSHSLQNTDNKSVIQQNSDSAVSLLSVRPINGPEILEIVDIKTPHDRMSLIGGLKGFLQSMQEAKVKPDIKTFCLLLECLPDNTEDEENLLSLLDSYKIIPIIDFFNLLIKRRNFRKDTEDARKVLLLLNKYELSPDIMTFGSLALGCRTFHQASTFIDEMKKFNSVPNIQIVGSLLRQATLILDFSYMKFVLKLMKDEDIKPDAKLLTTLEKALSNTRKNIILMEQGKEYEKFYDRKNLKDDLKEFCKFYDSWLKTVKFELEEHPWKQYKTEIIDRAQNCDK